MSKANGEIEVGDTVRIRYPPTLRSDLGVEFTVLTVKSYDNNATPFWTLENTVSQWLLIVDFEIVFEVMN